MDPTTKLVITGILTALDLFDRIQRNGQLDAEALRVRAGIGTQLRRALVAEANSTNPSEEPSDSSDDRAVQS